MTAKADILKIGTVKYRANADQKSANPVLEGWHFDGKDRDLVGYMVLIGIGSNLYEQTICGWTVRELILLEKLSDNGNLILPIKGNS